MIVERKNDLQGDCTQAVGSFIHFFIFCRNSFRQAANELQGSEQDKTLYWRRREAKIICDQKGKTDVSVLERVPVASHLLQSLTGDPFPNFGTAFIILFFVGQ